MTRSMRGLEVRIVDPLDGRVVNGRREPAAAPDSVGTWWLQLAFEAMQ